MSPEKNVIFTFVQTFKLLQVFITFLFHSCIFLFLDVYCQENLFVWENGLQNHVKAVWWRIQGGLLFYFFNNTYVYVVCSRGHETM